MGFVSIWTLQVFPENPGTIQKKKKKILPSCHSLICPHLCHCVREQRISSKNPANVCTHLCRWHESTDHPEQIEWSDGSLSF